MTVRGKFFVMQVAKSHPQNPGTNIKFGAVSASDNEKSENNFFHKYTPSGTIEMFVDNPPVEKQFEIGKVFYVDFSEAPAE